MARSRQTVRSFTNAQGAALAAGIKQPPDWATVAEFVAVYEFRRGGAYLEELNWETYKDFLSGWAASGTKFEFEKFYVSEVANTVFQEIVEHHHRGEQYIRKNVIAVYRFTPGSKIRHLDIYEQAGDSGDWIKQSAKTAIG